MGHHDALAFHQEPQLGQRRLRVGREPAGARQGLAHLAHAGALFQERRRHPAAHQLAEAVAHGLGAEQAQPAELRGALGREPQEPGQLPQTEDALSLDLGHVSA